MEKGNAHRVYAMQRRGHGNASAHGESQPVRLPLAVVRVLGNYDHLDLCVVLCLRAFSLSLCLDPSLFPTGDSRRGRGWRREWISRRLVATTTTHR